MDWKAPISGLPCVPHVFVCVRVLGALDTCGAGSAEPASCPSGAESIEIT